MTPPPGSWQPVPAREKPPREPALKTDPRPTIKEPTIPLPEPPTQPPEPPATAESLTGPESNGEVVRQVETCTFCGLPSGLVGYAWPDWLCEFLTDHQADWDVGRKEPGSDLTIFEQVAREIDETVTCVCETCTHGWIQKLEGDVREFMEPMILGEPTPLPAARRRLLARWTAKTAIVLEGTFPNPIRTPRFAADFVRKTGAHAGTQVLVGRYNGDLQILNRSRALFRKDTDAEQYLSYTTLVIGKLLVQVLADPWRDGVPEVPETARTRFIALVGNTGRKVEWPPAVPTGDAFFDAVRRGPKRATDEPASDDQPATEPADAPDPATQS